jgi:hypothetical protein
VERTLQVGALLQIHKQNANEKTVRNGMSELVGRLGGRKNRGAAKTSSRIKSLANVFFAS